MFYYLYYLIIKKISIHWHARIQPHKPTLTFTITHHTHTT